MVHGLPRHVCRALCAVTAAAALGLSSQAETLVTAAVEQTPPAPPPVTTGWPLDGEPARTRFVIGLDRAAEFQVRSLTNPNRVIVELSAVKLQLPRETSDKPIGLIKSFRGGLSGPSRSSIVIDVTEPVIVEDARVEKSEDGRYHRLVLDIAPVAAPAKIAAKKPIAPPTFALGAANLQPPLPRPAVKPAIRAARAFKPIIVIDPGHGGHDTGAQKNGTVEKDVVLAFGKALRDKLEATGLYKVMMTRDTDKFVELGERVAFAERSKANLFIAVHADYAKTQARGATIYSLRDSVAKGLQRSAKGGVADHVLSGKEVAMVQEASGDIAAVKSILADLAEREVEVTKDRTSVFARAVIEKMGTRTNLRDDPDQQASFRVLKTAQFPSVLIELAYVTNKEDARNLNSDVWRDKVSDSIVTAVDNYFSHQLARLPM